MRYSSCVTDTPLKPLVTIFDDSSVSRCHAMCCLLDRVVLRSNSVQPLIAFQCLPSSVLSGLPSKTMRACDRLHLRHRSSYHVRGSIYHAYNFQLTVPSSRIERLLDPTTYIYSSHMKLKQPCPSTSQQTMYCYVTIARCSAPA